MDITKLPFNAHVGVSRSSRNECLLMLTLEESLKNHLGTIHASALFSLAEASSGEFLIQSRDERTEIGGVVRRGTCKYSSPAKGSVFSQIKTPVSEIEKAIETIDARGKAMVDIDVDLIDESSKLIAKFQFTWLMSIEKPLRNADVPVGND